jgi:hypothetical protein
LKAEKMLRDSASRERKPAEIRAIRSLALAAS